MKELDDLEKELPNDKLQHVKCLRSLKDLQDAVCKTELDPQYNIKIVDFKNEYTKLRDEFIISLIT